MHVRQTVSAASRALSAAALLSLSPVAPVANAQVPARDSAASLTSAFGPRLENLPATIPFRSEAPRPQGRPVAVEHSEWFYRRQDLHRYASFLTLPLFVTQYLAGEELLKGGESADGWAKDVHPAVAAGIWGLFAVNTVTGVWNWWDTRGEPAGRTRRTLHAALMLAADIGFATIGEPEHEEESGAGDDGQFEHRRHAIVSMSIATAGYLLMLLPFGKD